MFERETGNSFLSSLRGLDSINWCQVIREETNDCISSADGFFYAVGRSYRKHGEGERD
jgi:hypothetical protein